MIDNKRYEEIKNKIELVHGKDYQMPTREQLENMCDLISNAFKGIKEAFENFAKSLDSNHFRALLERYPTIFRDTFRKDSNNYRKMHRLPLKRRIRV